jgi:hypothetical protein
MQSEEFTIKKIESTKGFGGTKKEEVRSVMLSLAKRN